MSDPADPSKKPYTPPAIEHEEVLEAIAAACSSQFDGFTTCRYAACDLPEN
ncbi:MAG: hypothetical protein AB7F75_07220 [Planctomycetota bacterium]